MSMMSLGFDPTRVRTSAEGPEFKLGTVMWEGDVPALSSSAVGVTGGTGGAFEGVKAYIYVKASGAITGDGYVCLISPAAPYTAAMSTDTLSAPGAGVGKPVGVARAAIADGGYGWLQIYGVSEILGFTAAAAFTQLTTHATAGQVDDATTAGLEVVDGMTLTEAVGGAPGLAGGFLNFPRVGRTL